MHTAIVWMPLAISPPKGPVAAQSGSVWMAWGSYCWAKATMSPSLTDSDPNS